MAHVGEKLGFGYVRGFGSVLGLAQFVDRPLQGHVGIPQFGGPGKNQVLKLFVAALELVVAVADPAQHLVEAADQFPDLVIALPVRPDGIIFVCGNFFHHSCQVQDGFRNDALEPA